jgi:hypothetical protein
MGVSDEHISLFVKMYLILFSVLVDHQEVIEADILVIVEVDIIQVIEVITVKVIVEEEEDTIIAIIEKVMGDHHKM